VDDVFELPHEISPAAVHLPGYVVHHVQTSLFDNRQHGAPLFIAHPFRYRELVIPAPLAALVNLINDYDPSTIRVQEDLCARIQEFSLELCCLIQRLIPSAGEGLPSQLSRSIYHPQGPFRVYFFEGGNENQHFSLIVRVRPATYWLMRSILNGFARLWARPLYGPAVSNYFNITLQVALATRFLCMGLGNQFDPDFFDGVPAPTGLWLTLDLDTDTLYAI
jgi:hypothetical protein